MLRHVQGQPVRSSIGRLQSGIQLEEDFPSNLSYYVTQAIDPGGVVVASVSTVESRPNPIELYNTRYAYNGNNAQTLTP